MKPSFLALSDTLRVIADKTESEKLPLSTTIGWLLKAIAIAALP